MYSARLRTLFILPIVLVFLTACGAGVATEEPTTIAVPTVQENFPEILSVVLYWIELMFQNMHLLN